MCTFKPGQRVRAWIVGIVPAILVTAVACGLKPASKEALVQQGDQLLANKEYAKAAAAYQVAVGVDGRDGPLRVKLANAYLLAGNWSAAEEHAVRASDLLPHDVDVQFLSARLMLAQRRFVDVADRMKDFLNDHPDTVPALVFLGDATAHLQDSTWALYSLPDAIRDRAAFEGARLAIRPGTASEDDKAAEVLFRKALQLSPSDTDTQLALVNFLWATGRPEEGEEILRRVADQNPGHVAVNYALGAYLLSKGRDAEGEKYLGNAGAVGEWGRAARFALADHYIAKHRYPEALSLLRAMPPSDNANEAVSTRIATVEFQSGQQEAAAQRLDAILAKDPGNKRALLLKAQLLAATQRWKDALAVARTAVAEDPKSGEARLVLGRALIAAGDADNAFDELSEAFRLDPGATEISIALTRISLEVGREQSAVQFAREAARTNPENREVALSLVRTLIEVHDYEGADTTLKGLLAKFPMSADVLAELGALNVARGNNDAARAAFARALQIDPNLVSAVSGIVSIDLKEKRINEARRRVDDALAGHPDDPEYLLLAARVYADAEPPRAQSLLGDLLRIDPANEAAALALSDLLARNGRAGDAKGALDQLLTRRPESVEGRTALGLLLEQMGRRDDAVAEYEKLVASGSRAPRASLRLARLYAEQGLKLEEALRLALDAKRHLGEDPAASDVIGWVYVQQGAPMMAISPLEDATRKAPNNPTYLFHLGTAYLRQEQFPRARDALKRALAIDPNFPQAAQARSELAKLF